MNFKCDYQRLWLTQSLSSTSRAVVSCLLIDVLGYQEGKKGLHHGWALLCAVVWCGNVFHHCFPWCYRESGVGPERAHMRMCLVLTCEFLYCWFLNNTVGCSRVIRGNEARRKIASCTFTMPMGSPLNLIQVILISKTVLTGAWKGRKIFLIKHQSSSFFIGQPFWRRNSL